MGQLDGAIRRALQQEWSNSHQEPLREPLDIVGKVDESAVPYGAEDWSSVFRLRYRSATQFAANDTSSDVKLQVYRSCGDARLGPCRWRGLSLSESPDQVEVIILKWDALEGIFSTRPAILQLCCIL